MKSFMLTFEGCYIEMFADMINMVTDGLQSTVN